MAAAPAPQNEKIVVLGLGYVGLPVAVALARAGFDVTGFDISSRRVASLAAGSDWTGEVADADLQACGLRFSDDPAALDGASFIIVTVPTPIDAMRRPDLGPIESACRLIGPRLAKGAVVVFESTVYPGVTEDICGPLLAEQSGLRAGADFFLGYSPERINPGDKVRRLETITKIVAADTPQALDRVRAVYGAIIEAGLHEAPSIRVAEAAKVIENAQRDINIAFMNEVTRIFARDGISVWDVLDAAGTKWNFLPFTPGLVGGHCIGVDPYYLSHRAEMLGHDPQVILAGRSINDDMGRWIADRLHDELGRRDGKILVLGLTFKENVPDLRNSKVADVIARLKWLGHEIIVHDPHADGAEAVHEYGITLVPDALAGQYDAVFAAVPHREYGALSIDALNALLREDGLLFDLKRLWPDLANGSAALAGARRYRGL
ncbi:nucleotide sugar dehydrogenase [Sphingopyxis soli]|uniref:Nucleotide sugar dehydrogenase n=1 Tax=Sphingopyxis soli TaxID=592051 RepID=A0ABP3XHN5_9SPHN|nr:nucleotide sugar dehydrogenase [Sphingopyxis soli]